jgi:hypothetical protein
LLRAGGARRAQHQRVLEGSAWTLTRWPGSPPWAPPASSSRASSTAMSLAMACCRRITSVAPALGVSTDAMISATRRTLPA